MSLMKKLLALLGLIFVLNGHCAPANNTLFVYNWANYLPNDIIRQFERETGIRVNYSTFDSNETLYAKLKSGQTGTYDVIFPSTYLIDRLRKENMLQPLDKSQLPNMHHLDRRLLNPSYDPGNQYSLPYLWGTSGLVINSEYFNRRDLTKWADLWSPRFKDQLLLIDDQRDVFAVALKSLGYSINDINPAHIKQAYIKLKALMPNVRLFNAEAIQALYIDEEVNAGMGLSGDIYLAQKENAKLAYIYPQEGVTIWVDSMAIPKGAQHWQNAYRFINFLLRPEIAAKISETIGYSSPNLSAQALLPKAIRENRIIYPTAADLKNGEFQQDIGEANLIYEKYWELLKIGG